MIRTLLVAVAFSIVVLHVAPGRAQDAATDRIYGSGVHAYFDGDLSLAQDYLDAAIEAGSRDPRAYYFRGLTRMQLGDAAAAERDFEQGAALEQGNVDRLYDVSRALERVQGPMRMTLESHRTTARLAAVKELEEARYQLYRQPENELTVEDPVPKPRPRTFTPVEPAATPTVEPEEPVEADPFASEAPAAAPPSAMEPMPAVSVPDNPPAALDDPFAAEPDLPESVRGTTEDPFEPIRREAGEAAGDPAVEAVPGVDAASPLSEEMPAEEPLPDEMEGRPDIEAPLDDPFAPEADLPADDIGTARDPFEPTRREAGEAADDPAMEEVPAAEAEEAPAAETPLPPASDPFAEEPMDADAPASEDPFAEDTTADEPPATDNPGDAPAAEGSDPFAEEPAPPPAGDAPGEEPMAEEPAADPFAEESMDAPAADAPASEDPFAEDASADEPPATDNPGDAPAAEETDPFAEEPTEDASESEADAPAEGEASTDSEESPPEEEMSAEEDDPFANP